MAAMVRASMLSWRSVCAFAGMRPLPSNWFMRVLPGVSGLVSPAAAMSMAFE